jgi:DNA-binding NtrC family response regulator
MKKPAILIVEADHALLQSLKEVSCHQRWEIAESSGQTGLPRALQKSSPAVVIVGCAQEGGWDGLDTAREIRRWDQRVPLMLITKSSSEELAIGALKIGVNDYFRPPFSIKDITDAVERWLAPAPSGRSSGPSSASGCRPLGWDEIIGGSPAMRAIKGSMGRLAATDSNVLITGETGTGKELVAELIHRNSPRREAPFVCINCAAIPDTLFESELFGHERGAFTGAHALREGAIEQADGGTVFFDEIGDMSAYAQAKVLRAIERKEIQRLGGRASLPLSVRVIAATNQDLEQAVAEGKFRRDLYFRLNVARIHLPPLRERKEDIPSLVEHYVREFNRRFGRDCEGFTPEAFQSMVRYEWPGNIRELKNILEAVIINLASRRIAFLDLPEQVRMPLSEAEALAPSERERLLIALSATNWNKSKAAQRLHWSRMTLYRKMAKYEIAGALRPAERGRPTPEHQS